MSTFDHTQQPALTPRQAEALPYLASAISLNQGAIRAQIGRSTLTRWMTDARFRSELQRTRDEAASLAKTKIQGLMLKSAIVLDEALDDPSAVLRERAARSILNAALKSQELDELRARMDIIDSTISSVKAQR